METAHNCGDLECIVEKFLSMKQAILRTSEYAVVVSLRGGRAFCTYVSLTRRDGIKKYESSFVCDPLATIAIYGRDGDSELLVLNGSCVDMLPVIVPRFVKLVLKRLGVPDLDVEFFKLDDNPFVYVRIGSDFYDFYQAHSVVLKKTSLAVDVLYPLSNSRVYISSMSSIWELPPGLVHEAEELKPIHEEARRLRDEIERELSSCTDPALRIMAEELLTLYYSVESVRMSIMTGYRVFNAPVIDEPYEKLELPTAEEILRTIREEYRRFNKEATSLLEELKKCRD